MSSAVRTIYVKPTSTGNLLDQPFALWPAKQPSDMLDFSVDLSSWLGDADLDQLAAVTVTPQSVAPGDVSIAALVVIGGVITPWLGYGVAYRTYSMDIAVATTGGRTLDLTLAIPIQPGAVPAIPIDPPAPVTWSSGTTITGPSPPLPAVVDNIQAAGTGQADATVLTGATNIVTGGTPGGVVKLPAIAAGTIAVLNRWSGVPILSVYPARPGQSIEQAGINQPAGVTNNAAFSLAAGSTVWRAS